MKSKNDECPVCGSPIKEELIKKIREWQNDLMNIDFAYQFEKLEDYEKIYQRLLVKMSNLIYDLVVK